MTDSGLGHHLKYIGHRYWPTCVSAIGDVTTHAVGITSKPPWSAVLKLSPDVYSHDRLTLAYCVTVSTEVEYLLRGRLFSSDFFMPTSCGLRITRLGTANCSSLRWAHPGKHISVNFYCPPVVEALAETSRRKDFGTTHWGLTRDNTAVWRLRLRSYGSCIVANCRSPAAVKLDLSPYIAPCTPRPLLGHINEAWRSLDNKICVISPLTQAGIVCEHIVRVHGVNLPRRMSSVVMSKGVRVCVKSAPEPRDRKDAFPTFPARNYSGMPERYAGVATPELTAGAVNARWMF
ncbi:hypothetical protein J6590_075595 [Homalodisca vitripennis]|nr:hypothetical protein J6590_075595 [Homalodisca vitripennis]